MKKLECEITEAEVVRAVKTVLIAAGLMKQNESDPGAPSRMQRINTGAFKQGQRFIKTANKGTLDFEGYDKAGRFLGIECKRPVGGRLSPEQKARINDIQSCGGTAGVVTNAQEALELLQTNGCI